MSLTLVCLYIVIGLCFLLFVNYKFLKLILLLLNQKFSTDANRNNAKIRNRNALINENYNNDNNNDEMIGKSLNPPTQAHKSIWSIPGPLIVPFLGSKWIYLWKYKMTKIHEVYRDFNREYGPIVLEVTSNGMPILSLYNRGDIEKVLRYPSKYPFRPPTEIVAFYRKTRPDRYASTGIPNEQGETWHNLRSKLTTNLTKPNVLVAMLPILNIICDEFIDLLRTKRDSKTNVVENFHDIANLFGLEAICTLMLGKRMGFLSQSPPENISKLAAAVKTLFITQRDAGYGFNWWKYISTKTYRDYVETEDTIYSIISEIVDEAIDEHRTMIIDENNINNVFYSILSTQDIDIRDKKSAIIDFIAAGIETFANTFIFALHYITASEDGLLEQIKQEFDKCSDEITKKNISDAEFTKACLQETFRVCPTAYCLARILQEDTILSGYHVPAGTVVLCQNMIACHNSENFNHPEQFSPERWITAEGKFSVSSEVGNGLIQPFGIGKRQCPGSRFVRLELILTLAKMARAFDIRFSDQLEIEFEFLLTPKTPINVILNDRTS